MPAIFISHSNVNNDESAVVSKFLRSAGFKATFLDINDQLGISTGSDWEKKLYREIETADAILLLLSNAWMDSKWCFVELSIARMLGKAILPAQLTPFEHPPVVPDLQHIQLYPDFVTGMESILVQLQKVALDARGGFLFPAGRPPYPGILSFDYDDAAVFFGRQPDIAMLWEALRSVVEMRGPRLIALSGASGSGKSSLLKAGLLPRLNFEPDRWLKLKIVRPAGDPFRQLSIALSAVLANRSQSIIGEIIRTNPKKAADWIIRELKKVDRPAIGVPILCIDQAEEIFTELDAKVSRHFLDLLLALASEPKGPIVVCVIRSEFVSRLQETKGYEKLKTVWLPDLSADRIRDVIIGPAKVGDIEVEEGLVARAIEDVGSPGSLPLLAYALRKLYDQFGKNGVLTESNYLALSGGTKKSPIEAAMQLAADDAVKAGTLDATELSTLKSMFMPALVRVDGTGTFVRRTAKRSEIPPNAYDFIDNLVDARLVRTFSVHGTDYIEVAHEALFRNWDLLARWLAEDRELLAIKEQIEREVTDVKESEDRTGKPSFLAEYKLARAEFLVAERPEMLSAEDRKIIFRSSRKKDRMLRRKRCGKIFSTLAVVGLVVLAMNLILKIDRINSQIFVRHAEDMLRSKVYTALDLANRSVETLATEPGYTVLAHALAKIPNGVKEIWKLPKELGSPAGSLISIHRSHLLFVNSDHKILGRELSNSKGHLKGYDRIHNETDILALDHLNGGPIFSISKSGKLEVSLMNPGDLTIDLRRDLTAAYISLENGVVSIFQQDQNKIEIWKCDDMVSSSNALSKCLSESPYIVRELPEDIDRVSSSAARPTGTVVVSSDGMNAAYTISNKLWIWRGKHTESPTKLDIADIRNMAWSPDGSVLAIVYLDGVSLIGSDNSFTRLNIPPEATNDLSLPVWNEEGTRLAVACGNSGVAICVWDVQLPTIKLVSQAFGHSVQIRNMVWDENALLTMDINGLGLRWNLWSEEGELVFPIRHEFGKNSYGIALRPKAGEISLAGPKQVALFEPTGKSKFYTVEHDNLGNLMEILWSTDGEWLAAVAEHGKLIVWKSGSTKPLHVHTLGERPSFRLAWNQNGKFFVASDGASHLVAVKPNNILAPVKQEIEGLDGNINGVGSSPKTGLVIALTDNGRVIGFNTISDEDGNEQHTGEFFTKELEYVAGDDRTRESNKPALDAISFRHDGSAFAVGGNSSEILVFEPGKSRPIVILKIAGDALVDHVEYSPSGRFLAALDANGNISVWDTNSFAWVWGLEGQSVYPLVTISLDKISGIHSVGKFKRFTWIGLDIVLSTSYGQIIQLAVTPDRMKERSKGILMNRASDGPRIRGLLTLRHIYSFDRIDLSRVWNLIFK